jgi:asparagine synthase (glutamine-hydrolysing)
VAKLLLSKFTKDNGFKAVLTGEGADEILGGYQYFREDMFLFNKLSENLLSKLKEESESSNAAYVSNGDYKELSFIKNKYGYIPSQFKIGIDIAKKINKYTNTTLLTPYHNFLKECKVVSNIPLEQSSYIWSKTFFPENILTLLGDRMEMANTLEGRLPFLDVDLVEFTCGLSPNMKINKDTEKFILRESLKDILPKFIYERKKHVFAAPPSNLSLNKSPLAMHFADIIHSKNFSDLNIFNKETKNILLDFCNEKDNRERMINEFVICLILSIYYLHKHYTC